MFFSSVKSMFVLFVLYNLDEISQFGKANVCCKGICFNCSNVYLKNVIQKQRNYRQKPVKFVKLGQHYDHPFYINTYETVEHLNNKLARHLIIVL